MANTSPPSAETAAAGWLQGPPRASGPAGISADSTPPALAGAKLAVGAFALSLATFMNVLDTTIANVSIPAISGDLAVSTSQGTWVITSFGVASAISVPLTGWLTLRLGAVRLFVTSTLLFVLTSWLCGLAPSIEWLVAIRVLQGAVAGPMVPLSQALLLASFLPNRAGSALALWSMTVLVAPVVGPLLGGWLTDNIGWPWIFYINVPVGLFAAGLTLTIYRHRETPRRKLPVDVVGLSVLVLWVGALQIMLDIGQKSDWFDSGTVVALATVALAGLAFFLVWEFSVEHPIVDLSLFRRRNFSVGVMVQSVGFALFFGSAVILTLWLQQDLGYSPTWAGMASAPVGLLGILVTPIAGRMIGKWDARVMAAGAFLLWAVVMWLRSLFTTQADFLTIVIPTVIQGAAMGLFSVPLAAIVLSGLPSERIAAASGLSSFFRIVAGSIGTSVATSLWYRRASMHHTHLAESVRHDSVATSEAIARLEATGLSPNDALAMIERMVAQQAYTLSANDLFYGSALLFAALAGLIWLTRPLPAHR